MKWKTESQRDSGDSFAEYVFHAYDDYLMEDGSLREIGEISQTWIESEDEYRYDAHFFGKYKSYGDKKFLNPSGKFLRYRSFDNAMNAKRWIETLYRDWTDYNVYSRSRERTNKGNVERRQKLEPQMSEKQLVEDFLDDVESSAHWLR